MQATRNHRAEDTRVGRISRSRSQAIPRRCRAPEVFGVRLYGLLGGGLSRFILDVRQQVEQPFPQGVPEDLLAPVLTYGGGLEKGLLPLVRWKFEVRDDVSPIPEELFGPGGSWHRVQTTVGIVIGR